MAKNDKECFGDLRRGSVFAERRCHTCLSGSKCEQETALMSHDAPTEKKPLDPKWAKELVDFMLGPNMAVLSMKLPEGQKLLEGIIIKAITALYAENDYASTNDWVVAASNRAWEMYNTYVTAKLMGYFDKGIPKKSGIILAKGTSDIH